MYLQIEPELELEDNNLTFKTLEAEKDESKVVGSSKIVIEFGKYKGMTLQEIYEKDINYIKYLRANAKDKKISQACAEMIA